MRRLTGRPAPSNPLCRSKGGPGGHTSERQPSGIGYLARYKKNLVPSEVAPDSLGWG